MKIVKVNQSTFRRTLHPFRVKYGCDLNHKQGRIMEIKSLPVPTPVPVQLCGISDSCYYTESLGILFIPLRPWISLFFFLNPVLEFFQYCEHKLKA